MPVYLLYQTLRMCPGALHSQQYSSSCFELTRGVLFLSMVPYIFQFLRLVFSFFLLCSSFITYVCVGVVIQYEARPKRFMAVMDEEQIYIGGALGWLKCLNVNFLCRYNRRQLLGKESAKICQFCRYTLSAANSWYQQEIATKQTLNQRQLCCWGLKLATGYSPYPSPI